MVCCVRTQVFLQGGPPWLGWPFCKGNLRGWGVLALRGGVSGAMCLLKVTVFEMEASAITSFTSGTHTRAILEKVLISPPPPRPLLLGDIIFICLQLCHGDSFLVVTWTVCPTPETVLRIQCHHDAL